ncbi:ATP-binding protein [Tateyamaria armeniaca]|uniref:histidine kinase n=1 Tax=Tateyamaria armeniaca TaxID=2518930 RepID=A0ABW8USI6_9RHOB
MKRLGFGAFARVIAIIALLLLVTQLFLVWRYVTDRGEGSAPGYRFPLPERVIAMADLVEATDDPTDVLIALNGPNLRVAVTPLDIDDLGPVDHRLAAVDRIFVDYERQLNGRPVAVFVAIPETLADSDIRWGDRSIWTRFPLRIAVGLQNGDALIVETRDDLLTQVYSVPIGWWSGIFASVAALIVLFALHVETRPLVRLAKATETFGKHGKPQIVPPGGSREAQALIASFNAMQIKLDDLLTRRGVMLGALGHDLRTHLTRLQLKIEALPMPETADILRNVVQMERVLENCLDLARNATSAHLETIELNAYVGDVLADYDGKSITYHPIEDVFVPADPPALERILVNLVDNALKFGTRADVEIRADPPSVTITDNGPGLKAADLERVFEPFEVADMARTQGQSGSGLGLTIARMLAEAQGAHLDLANNGGGGVTAKLEYADPQNSALRTLWCGDLHKDQRRL